MEPPGTAKCQADSVGKSTKQKCRDGQGRDFVLLHGLQIQGQGGGQEGGALWEEEVAAPLKCDGKKVVLGLTLGTNRNTVQSFLKQGW